MMASERDEMKARVKRLEEDIGYYQRHHSQEQMKKNNEGQKV
jgi:hypothetical protein